MSRTQDDEFLLCQTSVLRLDETITAVHTHIQSLLAQWKALALTSHDLFAEFASFYEIHPERLTPVALQYESVHSNIYHSKCEMLAKFFASNVLTKIESFRHQMVEIKKRIKEREVAKDNFDHYYTKILKLRAEKELAVQKGKFSNKDSEKYQRNETKFREAQAQYQSVNSSVAQQLWDFWKVRYLILDPIYNECVRTEILFVSALNNQMKPVLDELKVAISVPLKKEAKEAPYFAAKPPIGLEPLQSRRPRAGQQQYDDEAAANYDEDDAQYDEDEPARPVKVPVRRPAAPTTQSQRRPPPQSHGRTTTIHIDEQYDNNGHEEYLDDQPDDSGDFFHQQAQAQRKTVSARPAARPVTKSVIDPFAALDNPAAITTTTAPVNQRASAAAVDFFASAATTVPQPQPRKKPTVSVPAADVDFFSNAMSVSSSSPVGSTFASASSPALFDKKSAPSKSAAPKSNPLMGGLPALSASSGSVNLSDDPFAGLPLLASPPSQQVAPSTAPDFFAAAAQCSPPQSNTASRRASNSAAALALATQPPPRATPPAKPQPPLATLDIDDVVDEPPPARKASITQPAYLPSDLTEAMFDDGGHPPPQPLSATQSPVLRPTPPAVAKPPPPLVAHSSRPPPPDASVRQPPPPAIISPTSKPLPPLPPSKQPSPPSHSSFQPPPPAAKAAHPPAPPTSHASFTPPAPPGSAGVKLRRPSPRQSIVEDQDSPRGPAFDVAVDSQGKDPFAAFND